MQKNAPDVSDCSATADRKFEVAAIGVEHHRLVKNDIRFDQGGVLHSVLSDGEGVRAERFAGDHADDERRGGEAGAAQDSRDWRGVRAKQSAPADGG